MILGVYVTSTNNQIWLFRWWIIEEFYKPLGRPLTDERSLWQNALLTEDNKWEWEGIIGSEESYINCSVDGTLTSESLQTSNIVFFEITVELKWAPEK